MSAILQGVKAAGARSVTAILDPLDGAVHDVTSSASAFPWRAHQASVQWYSNVPRGDYAAARTWITAAHQKVCTVSAGAYVNYVEADVSPDRYFGRNRGMLASIRQAHDPGQRVHSPIVPRVCDLFRQTPPRSHRAGPTGAIGSWPCEILRPTVVTLAPTRSSSPQQRRMQARWYWYDWASTGYLTVTVTVLLATYLTAVANTAACPGQAGDATCNNDPHVLGVGIAPGSLVP